MSASRTLSHSSCQSVICVASGAARLLASDWKELIADLVASPHATTKLLICSGDGAPDARQREALFQVTRDKELQIGILTDSRMAGIVITAFQWMGGVQVKSFKRHQVEEALRYLDIPLQYVPEFSRTLDGLLGQVAGEPLSRSA